MSARRILLGVAVGFALALVPVLAFGQSRGTEHKTDSLTFRGVRAHAQTKPEDHTRNRHPRIRGWGGCVPSSVRTAALHAGIDRDQIDHFWRIAQERVGVGGTDPQLLAEMLRAAFPGEEWVSIVDSDPERIRRALDELSAKGHLLCSTMGWGAPELYGNGSIAHWVNLPHFSSSDGLACIEDNNDPPGVYRWVTADEQLARAMHGGQAWVFAFTRLPVVVQIAAMLLVAAALLLLASSTLLAGWRVMFSRPD